MTSFAKYDGTANRYEITAPLINGKPWDLVRKKGCTYTIYQTADGSEIEYAYEPSLPEEQKLLDEARLISVISLMHRNVLAHLADKDEEAEEAA